jgi:FtsH-binding integral membrane protein
MAGVEGVPGAGAGIRENMSMSNNDRNAAAPGTLAGGAIAVDAGLRAYMLRVYNYMAAGVGLTGIVAMLTYQFSGPELLQSPLMWVFMLAPLGLVFYISSRINTLPYQHAVGGSCATIVFRLCSLGRIVALDNLPHLHRLLDHARVLHFSFDLRSA